MSSIYSDIRSALDVQLDSIAGIPPIKWDVASDPKSDDHVTMGWLPGSTEPASLGPTGLDRHIGVYQIDLLVVTGVTSNKTINTYCDLIADHFKPRQDLVYNGVAVKLQSVSRNAAVNEGKHTRIAIDIEYQAITPQRS